MEKLTAWSYYRQGLDKSNSDALKLLGQIVGVYSAHPSGPLSLWARVHHLKPKDFHALEQGKKTIRIPAMRLSAYMLPLDFAEKVFPAVVPPADDPVWVNRYEHPARGILREKYLEYQQALFDLLKEPLTVKEMKSRLDIPDDKLKLVLNRMAFERKLVRVGSVSLRSNIISYIRMDHWHDGPLKEWTEVEAPVWLAEKYLQAFGPARVRDFQWWAGITMGKARAAVEAVETVEVGDEYLLLKADENAYGGFNQILSDEIAILPQWDSYTMGYAPDGRARFVEPEYQHHIYGDLGATGGNGLGTILVGGMAHAAWKSQVKGTKMLVSLDTFKDLSSQQREEVNHKFGEIANFLGLKQAEIQ